MKLTTLNLLTLAATAAGTSQQIIKNYCGELVYATIYHNYDHTTNGPFEVPSGEAYKDDIISTTNTVTITKSSDVFTEIPKLVLGTSSDFGILYWSVNNITGDPFKGQSFAIMSAFTNGTGMDICQNATSYDGLVHACTDSNVTLSLNLCQ